MRTTFASVLLSALITTTVVGCAAEDVREDESTTEALSEPTGSPAKYPFILEHGFNASSTTRGFYKVKEALEADGHKVYVSEVPPFQSVERRAEVFRTYVDRALTETGATKVNIIAHSMGGLDARYLVSSLHYGDRVASLTTISTPHRGTFAADVALRLVKYGPLEDAVNHLANAYGRHFTDDDLARDPDIRAAFEALAEKNAAAFQESNPDDPHVFYQSWAGVSSRLGIGDSSDVVVCEGKLGGRTSTMSKEFTVGSLVVGHGLGTQASFRPNDGMVTVESAKWGEFRGCVRADHFDEIGQPAHDRPNDQTGFDHRRFYRVMAFELSARGF